MNYSITQNGKPLDSSLYTIDESTKTFSTNANDLVIDFSDLGGWTFKTGFNCTFKTGPNCTFKTGYHCTFDTVSYCTFDTGSYCTFKTGYDCTFKTGSYCTFNTFGNCIIESDYDIFVLSIYDDTRKVFDLPKGIYHILKDSYTKLDTLTETELMLLTKSDDNLLYNYAKMKLGIE